MQLHVLKDILVELPVMLREAPAVLNQNIVRLEIVKDEAAVVDELENVQDGEAHVKDTLIRQAVLPLNQNLLQVMTIARHDIVCNGRRHGRRLIARLQLIIAVIIR